MKKVFTKIYLYLNNLWFILALLIFAVDLLSYYASYFNPKLDAQIAKYTDIYDKIDIYTSLLVIAMFIVFVLRIYKKATSTITSSEEKKTYAHFPERFIVYILLMLISLLVEETLVLSKGEPPQKNVFCKRTQTDPSISKYKPALDYFFQKTTQQRRYSGIERILPCLVIQEKEPPEATDSDSVGNFIYAFFDKKNARDGYLPIYVRKDTDISNNEMTAAILSYGLFPAFNYMLEQEVPERKKASCLQSIVNAYNDSSSFLLGTDLFVDKEGDGLSLDTSGFTDNQKTQYVFLAFQFDKFYLEPASSCSDLVLNDDFRAFRECFLREKIKNIEDFVYNDKYYREQCAYE